MAVSVSDDDKVFKTGLEQNVRKRKRKKVVLRIVLLILLLLFLFIGIGVYFIVSNTKKDDKPIALNMTISSVNVYNDREEVDKVKQYHYDRGSETSTFEEIDVSAELLPNKYYRVDYVVENLSNITYTYVVDFTQLSLTNIELKYRYVMSDEIFDGKIPDNNVLRLAYNKDFKFSIEIKIDNPSNDATCEGLINFTIEIM